MTEEIQISERNGHKLVFNDKEHLYTLDDKPIRGVTTINKEGYPISFALTGWMVGEGAKFAIEKLKELQQSKKRITEDAIVKIVKSSKVAYRKVAKKSADIGTKVHDLCYYHELGDQQMFDSLMIEIAGLPDEDKIHNCIELFSKWKKENRDDFIMSEALVASPTHWYAGKFDRLVNRNGKVILSDFKTSSGIFVDMFIQLAGYAYAIKEWYGITVDGIEIIRFGKYDAAFETKLVTDPQEIKDYTDQFLRNVKTVEFRYKYDGE